MDVIFREYDIRGIVDKDLTVEKVKKIGVCIGRILKEKNETTIGIGFDCRIHSQKLMKALVCGLNFSGITPVIYAMIPTPVCYFATNVIINEKEIKSSIMITGSHLSKEYNGLKVTLLQKPFFGEDIIELGKNVEDFKEIIPDSYHVEEYTSLLEDYSNYILPSFTSLKNFPKRIVVDNMNGVGSLDFTNIAKELNLDVLMLNEKQDPNFSKHDPDPSKSENLVELKETMLKNNIELGFAFDGDADRLYVIYKNEIIYPDVLGILFSKLFNNPKVIGDVKCTSLFFDEINKIGEAIMCKTGHSNVKVKISETKADFAVELSGHIFFNKNYFGFDDGTYALLKCLEVFNNSKINVDEILTNLPKVYLSEEFKVKVEESTKFSILKKIILEIEKELQQNPEYVSNITIDGLRFDLKEGWGLIRASNTSPYLTGRFEAKSKEKLEEYQKKYLKIIRSFL